LALNEMRRCHPQASVLQHIAPSCIFLQAPCSFDQLTHPWRHQLPIYLHHLFPVQMVLPLEATLADLSYLKQAVQEIMSQDTIIQVRSIVETEMPYTVVQVQRLLNENRSANSISRPTGRVLSLLIAAVENELRAYLGVSWASQNLSPWPGGQIPITEPVSNRAGYKLLEALSCFAIYLRRGDYALDLGAAPGAWTTLLRRRNLQVTAVAPTALYPWLMFDSGVTYEPMRAEDYLSCCQTTFDLIVNDMKLDAQDSARLMVDYAQHLRREGIAIMTVKLRMRNEQRVMDHTFRILRRAYKIIRVRQLVSNQQEVTLFLRRKPEGG
jgi:23S rRNA (cytidine2498-2'-O)-methyltransferase